MTNIPNAASAVKSYCRNARCRSKLSAPVTNPQKAFCVRGCYESFYRSRCRVCEAAIERKAEHQKFCKRPRCKSRFRADPTQFEWSGYPCSGDARRPQETQ